MHTIYTGWHSHSITHRHTQTHRYTSPLFLYLHPYHSKSQLNRWLPSKNEISLVHSPFLYRIIVIHSVPKSIRLYDSEDTGDIVSLVDFPLTPRRLIKTLFSRQNLSLVLMYPITDAYVSFLFTDINCASRLWNLSDSTPMPPNVDITIGVKDPFSIWIIRSL